MSSESDTEIDIMDLSCLSSIFETKNKILIIGDSPSGKSTLIQKFLKPSTVITDKEHYIKFYSQCIFYCKYGDLLKKRLFIPNTCLIIDNYTLNENYYKVINEEVTSKNMLFIYSSEKFIKELNFDYILITKFSNTEEISKIHSETGILEDLEEFTFILNSIEKHKEIIVVDCNNRKMMIGMLI